jgi:hypothetical protein
MGKLEEFSSTYISTKLNAKIIAAEIRCKFHLVQIHGCVSPPLPLPRRRPFSLSWRRFPIIFPLLLRRHLPETRESPQKYNFLKENAKKKKRRERRKGGNCGGRPQ